MPHRYPDFNAVLTECPSCHHKALVIVYENPEAKRTTAVTRKIARKARELAKQRRVDEVTDNFEAVNHCSKCGATVTPQE